MLSEGLTKARVRGARVARGSVLVFLDAHCEAINDWLRPHLQRIREKRDAVLTPIIEVIDQTTFKHEASESFQVGGFVFSGHFTWIDVPEREKIRRGSEISPTWSPTMAGGLFAIDREYYWELGAYDEQMAGWGGENLEMSFRIWQCGGTLETIPCSRVGHVFRSFHPYSMPASSDTHGINTARMAEVWMDDYAELFYLYRPDLRKNPIIGDVTHRKILREKLHCKSFQWYLDNIYKEKFVPVRDAYAYGRIRNPATNLCLDTLQREGDNSPLGVYPCHPVLSATQHFSISLSNELRDEENCATIPFQRNSGETEEDGNIVRMSACKGKKREQKWRYVPETQELRHTSRALCVDAGRAAGADLRAKPCDGSDTQQWSIDYTEQNGYKLSDGEMTEQEAKLLKLKGQQRKSRSLLSVGVKEKSRRRGHKKHKKRARSVKNKFILKLVRSSSNGTEEHLEVDIHCKHHQLFPNNSFVRDLVNILNDKDIKVINNGRVFEKNRVVQISDNKILNKLTVAKGNDDTVTEEPLPELPPTTERPSDPEPPPRHLTHEQRILVEDFTEPTDTTTKRRRLKKKKRPHMRAESTSDITPLTTPPTSDDEYRDQNQEILPMSSFNENYDGQTNPSPPLFQQLDRMWDKNPTDTELDDDKGGSTWEGSFPPLPLRQLNSSIPAGQWRRSRVQHTGDQTDNRPPLKMLVHSNLTFKLADSFFKRTDDHTDSENIKFTVDMNIPEENQIDTTTESDDRKQSDDSSSDSSSD